MERTRLGGFTLRYDDGPKQNLVIHFAAREELLERATRHFTVLAEPVEERIVRTPPETGFWAQWEAVWMKR
jgi:hypothetical protein